MVDKLQRRNELLTNENHDLRSLRQNLYIEKDRLTMKMSSLNREHTRQKLLVSDLQKELKETQYFMEQLKKDKEELIESIQQKDQELREVRKESKELSMQVNDEDGAQSIIKALKKKNETLEDEIMREVKLKNNLTRQLDSMEEDLQVMKLKNKDLTQHVSNLSGSVKKYELAYNALQSSRDALLSNKTRRDLKLKKIIGRIADSFKVIKDFQKKMKSYVEQTHNQSVRELKKELAELKTSIVKSGRMSERSKEVIDLKEKVEILRRNEQILKGKVQLLEQQMIEYKMKYAEALNSNTELEKAHLSFTRN